MEFKDLKETTISRKDVFEGQIMTVHVDQVRLPNGEIGEREVIDHVGGVGILAIDDEDRVLTVTQYRYVFSKTLLEIPAGKLDWNEDHRLGGLRELREETGAVPEKFEYLGSFIPAPGCYMENLHLYLATGLKFQEQDLDPDEFLHVDRIPFDEMVERCVNGEIEDGKTIIAVLRAKALLHR